MRFRRRSRRPVPPLNRYEVLAMAAHLSRELEPGDVLLGASIGVASAGQLVTYHVAIGQPGVRVHVWDGENFTDATVREGMP